MKTADYRTAKVLVKTHERARKILERIQRDGTRSLPAGVLKCFDKYGVTLASTFEAGLAALEEKLWEEQK